MVSSVDTKARKKQSPLSQHTPNAAAFPYEKSLLVLENACLQILESQFAAKGDMDRLYWQQRFKNAVTPISLALREYNGQQRFHNHYRHREDDESVLHPVLEPSPIDMLAQVCEQALDNCRGDLVGIRDRDIVEQQRILESALQNFLARYKKFKSAK